MSTSKPTVNVLYAQIKNSKITRKIMAYCKTCHSKVFYSNYYLSIFS